MSDIVIMNGGESPLASKIKKGDATKAEDFPQAGSGAQNGGAAPTFPTTTSPKSKEVSTSDDIVLAKGGGIVRPRSGSKKS